MEGRISATGLKSEADSKKIDCYAILDLFIHSFKCLLDSLKCCCFKLKIS